MRPKFQKRSALKFDGRIIPEAKPSGINVGLIPPLGAQVRLDTPAVCGGVVHYLRIKGGFAYEDMEKSIHDNDRSSYCCLIILWRIR